jgi:hypothetical protein
MRIIDGLRKAGLDVPDPPLNRLTPARRFAPAAWSAAGPPKELELPFAGDQCHSAVVI